MPASLPTPPHGHGTDARFDLLQTCLLVPALPHLGMTTLGKLFNPSGLMALIPKAGTPSHGIVDISIRDNVKLDRGFYGAAGPGGRESGRLGVRGLGSPICAVSSALLFLGCAREQAGPPGLASAWAGRYAAWMWRI